MSILKYGYTSFEITMRLLITGGAGFVGSHIVEWHVRQGDQVLVVDNLCTGKTHNIPSGVSFEQIDVADCQFRKITSLFKPDLITHCAAQASVADSVDNPVLDAKSNILGGLNVWRAASESNCPEFTYIATGGALYGPPEYLPCDEDHPIQPVSPYGLSKWTLEQYLKMLFDESVSLKVLRLSNVYGPRQDPGGEAGVVAIFGQSMLMNKTIRVFGDGEQTRDFVYAGDVARAHAFAIRTPGSLTVNISSGVGTTVNELCRMMSAETGYTGTIRYESERSGDVRDSVMSNVRAKTLLGWEPETSLPSGLKQTLRWFKENSNL